MKASSSLREIVVASGLYAASSIIGPLVVFGGIGMLLDDVFETGPWLLLGGVLVAFVVTNVLLFRKVMKLTQDMETIGTSGENGAEEKETTNTIT
jgi:F0F1-type ATP synthase assembly protein I